MALLTQPLTCIYKLRKPNVKKRTAIDLSMCAYTLGAQRLLDWCEDNLEFLQASGQVIDKKTMQPTGKYTGDSVRSCFPSTTFYRIDVSSKVKDALFADVAGAVAGYFESAKVIPNTSFPTAFALVEDERLLALEQMRFLGDNLEEENVLRSKVGRKPKSSVRPLSFCRSSDFRLLVDRDVSTVYVWMCMLPAGCEYAVPCTMNGTLYDINTGEKFYQGGKTGILMPLEIGIRNGNFHWQFTDYLLPSLMRVNEDEEDRGDIDDLLPALGSCEQRCAIKTAKLIRSPSDEYFLAVSFEFRAKAPYETERLIGLSRDTLYDLSYALVSKEGVALDYATEQTGIADLQVSTAKSVAKKQRRGKAITFRDYKSKQLDGLLHVMANRLIDQASDARAAIICESSEPIRGKRGERNKALRVQYEKLIKILKYKCKILGVPLRTEVFGAKAGVLCVSCGVEAKTQKIDGTWMTVCSCGDIRSVSQTRAVNTARRVNYKKSEWEKNGGYLSFHRAIASRAATR
jgi:hypothetical protein